MNVWLYKGSSGNAYSWETRIIIISIKKGQAKDINLFARFLIYLYLLSYLKQERK